MSDLPGGWAEIIVGDAGQWGSGGTPSSKNKTFYGGSIPWIRSGDLPDGPIVTHEITITDEGLANSSAKWVPEGAVLIAMYGATIGKLGISTYPVTTNQAVAFCETNDAVEQRFLFHGLAAKKQDLIEMGQGGAQPNISQQLLKAVEFPLPPLPEQRRIVAKVDGLTARTARARKELNRIPTLIARHKQRLLALAFSGELTASWRAAQLELAKSSVENSKQYHVHDAERGEWEVEVLPSGWAWQSFGEVFSDVTDSKRKLPTKEYLPEGKFPIVDQGMQEIAGYSDREDMAQRAEPPYIVFGDHTRCIKLIGTRFVQGADGVKVFNARGKLEIKYLFYALKCVRLPDKGYSRHMKFLRATNFPVCNEAEQAEIVRRIESAFGWLDRMAADHATASKLLPRLDAAILTKAFRGELVPQDPNDEPASVLLERIKAEREAAPRQRGRKATLPVNSATASGTIEITGSATATITAKPKKSGAKSMTKSRLDPIVKGKPYLAELTREMGGAISANKLYAKSALSLVDFYMQLSFEHDEGWLIDDDQLVKAT